MVSSSVKVKESNKSEVITIKEELEIFKSCLSDKLIVQSDSSNVIDRVSFFVKGPRTIQFILHKIRVLFSSLDLVFAHAVREPDIVVAVLEEQGIDRRPKVVGLMLSPDGVAVLFFFLIYGHIVLICSLPHIVFVPPFRNKISCYQGKEIWIL